MLKCDCGKELILGESKFYNANKPKKSCGCMEFKQNKLSKIYPRLFNIWNNMKSRCYRNDSINYSRYGAKGVDVCDEWLENFESFLFWAKNNGYEENLTLDRINNSKGYNPNNCRWVDYYVQAENRGLSIKNKTGKTGVFKKRNSFISYMMRKGIRVNLGSFKTLDEAINARLEAERQYKMC